MFAKLFFVALAVICASAAPPARQERAAVVPLAYSAVPYSYSSPVAAYSTYSAPAAVTAYSTYSGSPVAYSTYSANPVAYSAYSAPVVASPYYY